MRKQTIKTSRTAGQLEKMFRMLNDRFFGGELEEPVITLKKTPNAYGHITCGKVWNVGEEHRYEINLGTNTLARPIEETTATLLHEICHLYNIMHGIQDCSRNNTYHNKKFKACAESHGLECHYDERIGWSHTTPNLELLDFIQEQGWQDIMMNEEYYGYSRPKPPTPTATTTTGTGTAPTETRKPSSTRKYQCPKCKNSCRATKNINIMCMDCNTQMIVV